MSILILAEHNNSEVKSSTLNTISAASKVGSEIEVLVVGSNIENIAKEIANYEYVKKSNNVG
jgi:electron transfer flavoprotein alpha subunit